MNNPNILFIFSDQQRWDTMGCYGQELDTTPNLDRIAARGTRFEHAYSCQPVCGPARACLQTGKYAAELGVYTNHKLLPRDEKTLANHLYEAGYEVGYIGKWHLASFGERGGEDDFRTRAVPIERRGGYIDYWLVADALEFTSHSYDGYMFDADGNKREFPEGRYRADAQTDWVIEYLENRKTDKPFYLMVSYIEPHHQNDHNRYEGPEGSKDKYRDFKVPGDLVDTEGDWRENFPDYLGCVNSLDYNAGRIFDTLEKRGELKNTVVIYTSDHGSHFRTRNGEYKRSCHDACIRIPMIISGPGFTGKGVPADLVSLIDIPPTILRAGGVTPPKAMRGRPLQDLADGSAEDWPEEIFLQISESQTGRAIRTKKWKYSITAPDKDGHAGFSDMYAEDFLYDLEKDPHERNNLVSDPAYAGLRAELRETMKRRMQEAGEEAPEIKPKALGIAAM